MSEIKKVFTQTSWQLLGKVITSLSTIIILGILTRKFGPSGIGSYSLSVTYLVFLGLATDLGVNAHILSRIVGGDYEVEWRKLFGLRIILGAILILLTPLFLLLLPIRDELFRQLVYVGLVFGVIEGAVFVTCNVIFQANQAYKYSSIAAAIGSLLTLGAIAVFSQNDFSLIRTMVANDLGWIAIALISMFFVRKYIKLIVPLFDFGYIKKVLLEAWPISLTLVFNVIYFRVDSFILSSVRSLAEVGIYNVAYQIFQAALVLPTFIMNGLYPILLTSFRDSKLNFLNQVKKAALILIAISVVGLVLTYILAPSIIRIISGPGFDGSVDSLRILAVGFPAFFVSSLLMWVLISMKKYKTVLVIYLIGLVFNFLANLIFTPIYSYLAASWITGISEYLILVIQFFILYRAIKKI